MSMYNSTYIFFGSLIVKRYYWLSMWILNNFKALVFIISEKIIGKKTHSKFTI